MGNATAAEGRARLSPRFQDLFLKNASLYGKGSVLGIGACTMLMKKGCPAKIEAVLPDRIMDMEGPRHERI
jgi:hypothetical protein